MPSSSSEVYDVFISYSHADRKWVREKLLPRLESSGLQTCIDYRDFVVGMPVLSNMERAAESSRFILLVLTPDWLNSEWSTFEALLTQTVDPSGYRQRLIPLLLEPCQPPARLRMLTYADFTTATTQELAWRQLLTALGGETESQTAKPSIADWQLSHVISLPSFVDRQAERKLLADWLDADESHSIMVLAGVGGIGKSALAWYWLTNDVDRRRWLRVFWWSFYEDPDFESFLRSANQYFAKTRRSSRDKLSLDKQTDLLLASLNKTGTLLILDGIERLLREYPQISHADDLYLTPEEMKTQQPARFPARVCASLNAQRFFESIASHLKPSGKILLTTRVRPVALERADNTLRTRCTEIQLDGLELSAGVALLSSLGVRGTRQQMERICMLYGLHPLSILLLGNRIARDRDYPGDSSAPWVEIDLDARVLELCDNAAMISKAHRKLVASELDDPTGALPIIRSFSRISRDVELSLGQESAYYQRLALRNIQDRLDSLGRELTRSADAYAGRFRPIANNWRHIIHDHELALSETSRLREEIANPYVIGIPLTLHQEIFVGRTDISARIEHLVLNRRRPSLLLYGQRRMGKTSLLSNLGRLLPSSIIPLLVDLQGPVTQASDHAGFLYNLARGMRVSAQHQRGRELPPLDRNNLTSDPFTCFDEWLDEVETALGQDIALLALDEFEALDRAIVQERFSETDILGMLRHLIQHRPRFKVLLAGSHTLNEFQRWASYLINVQVVHISYLKEDEARKLIERPVADFALCYQPDASRRVLDITHCHPFLVQLLCGEIVALKNEQEVSVRRLARLADVEAAAEEALDHGSFFFADIERNQVDVDGLALLRALATQGKGATLSREQLAAQLTDPTRLEYSLTSLIQRELIEPADGGYRFQVELIRRWFAKRSS